MGLLDVFKPKWKHSNPEVRTNAVNENIEDTNILEQLFSTDPDARVRQAAASKIINMDYLKEAIQTESDKAVKLTAQERVFFLASQKGLTRELSSGIKNGFTPNLSDHDKTSVLMYAAYGNRSAAIKYLVEEGANVNHANRYGATPLLFAAYNGNIDAVNLLLQSGADPNQVLTLKMKLSRIEVQEEKLDDTLVMRTHTDLNAIWRALLKSVISLKEVKDIEVNTHGGKMQMYDVFVSPLVVSISKSFSKISKVLLSAGADPNLATVYNLTPLRLAVEKNDYDLAKTLLENGARTDVADWIGSLPNDVAHAKKRKGIIKLLQKKQAKTSKSEKNDHKEILETGSEDSVQVFYQPAHDGDAVCSDNNCPCTETSIPRGTGYLYIDPIAVAFRKTCPTMDELQTVLDNLQNGKISIDPNLFAKMIEHIPNVKEIMQVNPSMLFYGNPEIWQGIIVCKKGAKLRGLNLEIAAEDARRWWKTGEVPLRATPKAK